MYVTYNDWQGVECSDTLSNFIVSQTRRNEHGEYYGIEKKVELIMEMNARIIEILADRHLLNQIEIQELLPYNARQIESLSVIDPE